MSVEDNIEDNHYVGDIDMGFIVAQISKFKIKCYSF